LKSCLSGKPGVRSAFIPLLCLILTILSTSYAQADFTDGLVYRWTFNDPENPLVDDIGGVYLTNGGGVVIEDGMAIFDGSSTSFVYSTDPRVNSYIFGSDKSFTVWFKLKAERFEEDYIFLINRSIDGSDKRTSVRSTLSESSFGVSIHGNNAAGTLTKARSSVSSSFLDKESTVALGVCRESNLVMAYSNGVASERSLGTGFESFDIGIFTVGQWVIYYDEEPGESRGRAFIGRIDEIRIYDRCLTEVELDAIEGIPFDPSPSESIKGVLLFPNPSSTSDAVRIAYHTERVGEVEVSIYDESGRRVWYVKNDNVDPGYNDLIWDGRDFKGQTLPTGIYRCVLSLKDAGGAPFIKSGTLIRGLM
jgi:hypothetical protein